MRVDDIRGQLRRHGVSGISALRKPELVKTLTKTLRSSGAGRRSSGPAGRAGATKSSGAKQAASGRTASGRAKAAPAKRAAPGRKATGAAAKSTAGTARKTTSAARRSTTGTARKSTAGARKSTPRGSAPSGTTAGGATRARKAAPTRRPAEARPARGGAVRTGRSTSRSVRSSQVISSLQDRPERPGRSLVTTNHDVIRRWARERGAKPATISGTEREGRAGVLTFNIPGYRESSRIREITWDEWFHTFDLRRLNLIYQEQMRDGRPSNFFRTESPDREDG
ncbi:hypothetical protein O3597_28300 [Verrucosispora sp. WMMA2044]|uniref:hypothetical protein n=1 Tax=Verrucosispora sp. WMMA2044 TaxID=3016419 RepID=UPI00248CFABA|nr:hypothetical protein [Verrucosispora sp. WMMA2044]WBB51918.1 hypothetical protein O3597_28300 [Verrucosispora sp. WMMA2044]